MSARRMAGSILGVGALGSAGALVADATAHDETDRAAQSYKNWAGSLQGADEIIQQVYVGVFGQGEMSMADRAVAMRILSGELPPTAATDAMAMADTPAGKKGIKLAGQLMVSQPELGPPAADLAKGELGLFEMERKLGVTPRDVMAAADQGAGVSPVPAILGGLGVGGGAAIVDALMRRRGARA